MPTHRPNTGTETTAMTGRHIPCGYRSPASLAGLPAGEAVLLGLSGGADSASLLDMLVSSGENVILCHVNHGIRGEEAMRDQHFCGLLAEKYGLEIIVRHIDVPAEAGTTGEGLEEAARRLRYGIFSEIMKERGIKLLATAHNANDNAETVLFNISRGCGTKGACGIPAVRRFGDGFIVRPLLRVGRREIEKYCSENLLEYVTDSTNLDANYSRNRIRLNVIPELERINPDFISAVTRFTDSVSDDTEWTEREAEAFLSAHDGGFGREDLSLLPRPVTVRIISKAAASCGAKPEKKHIDALMSALADGSTAAVTMPGSVIGSIGRNGRITFVFDKREKKKRTEE